ncbi:class F sortase [Streptomyces iconiensis]|uniref:Class F sortase n=1 Tax=Streptomyces iconiensis TaxID=1384038 RepID=A0ABT6ZW23_9ACTN|nr:class F sortase [Streptomyces iconiensis]MDJ1133275.1 class F sortase [Streptomyces iconiensis]
MAGRSGGHVRDRDRPRGRARPRPRPRTTGRPGDRNRHRHPVQDQDGSGHPDEDAREAGGRGAGKGRLLTGAAWVMVLLALWMWGRGLSDGAGGGPLLGDVSQAGRLAAGVPALPPAHAPLDGGARPVRVDIDGIGVHAPVMKRGVEPDGGIAPPPYSRPGSVGWYARGPAPGEAGAALLVGHVDTERRKAVFYALSTLKPGARVAVRRSDGSTAEFTVERSRVVGREDFDAHRAYGPERQGRAELRLITCGGTFDRARRVYSSNVIVSAYLTGSR